MLEPTITEKELDDFRKIGDPPADKIIDAIVNKENISIDQVVKLLEGLVRMPPPDQLDSHLEKFFGDDPRLQKQVKDFLVESVRKPDWIRDDTLKLGGDVFREYAFHCFLILGCASLPICYVCSPDVRILGYTRRLIDKAPVRLIETAQMVSDVMSLNELRVEGEYMVGKGAQATQKIRLMHASIRRLVKDKDKMQPEIDKMNIDKKNPPCFLFAYLVDHSDNLECWCGDSPPARWDLEKDGEPINQEAAVETLLTFSYVILRGLKRIGIHFPKEQQDAYIHRWNVVGHLMGIDPRLTRYCKDYDSAHQMFETIITRRRRCTKDGIQLEQALLDLLAKNGREVIPSPWSTLLQVDRFGRVITTKLVSEKTAETLELKLSPFDRFVRLFQWAGVRFGGWLTNFPLFRRFTRMMFRAISKTMWAWRAEEIAEEKSATTRKEEKAGAEARRPVKVMAAAAPGAAPQAVQLPPEAAHEASPQQARPPRKLTLPKELF